MHKVLELVRQLLPETAPTAKSEVFGSTLLDELMEPYVATANPLAFCFGRQLWADMLCEPNFIDNFDPVAEHDTLITGYVGCYKRIPMYTDGVCDSDVEPHFLPERHLVLALLSRDHSSIEALIRLDTTIGFRPNRAPVVGTLTQGPADVVERRAKMLEQIKQSPETPYYAPTSHERDC